jgi:cytochrome oxidase Cu insertion factor (SCO1/SenC/PrrC family)
VNLTHRPIALLALLLSLGGPAGAVWTVGSTPTDFTCTDWNGQSWNLYAQRGKVVLLNFGPTRARR